MFYHLIDGLIAISDTMGTNSSSLFTIVWERINWCMVCVMSSHHKMPFLHFKSSSAISAIYFHMKFLPNVVYLLVLQKCDLFLYFS